MSRYPFRLGTTSYIVPDEIIPNVRFLAGKVDDVELVLFESDEFSNLPSPNDIGTLCELAGRHGLTYSVHLPLDVYLGHPDRHERERSVGKCLRIIELVTDLPKSAFVMHFESGPGVDINLLSPTAQDGFVEGLRHSAAMLLGACDEPSWMFCAENLSYPFELVWPVVEESGFSVTLDVGHVEHFGFPLDEYLERFLPKARVLHMHGSTGGKDHNSLAFMRPAALDRVVDALVSLGGAPKVFTLEIFSQDDFTGSVATLSRFLR